MTHLFQIATTLSGLLLLTVPVQAQQRNCAGVGNAKLEIIMDRNEPLGSGTSGTVCVIGQPNTCYWLVCDVGRGAGQIAHPLFGVANLCLPLGPNYVNAVDECLGASGVHKFPFRIPLGFTDCLEVCCQWAGIDPVTFELTVSNVVCINTNLEECEKVNQLAYTTCFQKPSSFPVDITSTFDGGKEGRASISFNPANPPSFPVTNGKISIEKITVLGNELCVLSRIDAGRDSKGGFEKLDSNTELSVSVGRTKNEQSVHTSCSKPLAPGMVFGKFVITDLFDTQGCECCEGGVNTLGYCTTVNAPSNYPVRVTSRISEKDLSSSSSVGVSFDPNNPPSFPVVSGDGKVAIEGIRVVGNKLEVCSFADAGRNSKGERQKFPDNNMLFHTSAGGSTSEQVIHVSCSKPVRSGLSYGNYTITRFSSVKDCVSECKGGINVLGLQTSLDQPSSYPTRISASFSDKGKNPSSVSVNFDPNTPPSFPIIGSNGKALITNIAIVNGRIRVNFFADNGRTSGGDRNKFTSSNMTFTVGHPADTNSREIHVSCSQPIGKGSVFGDFLVIALKSAKK